jgi:hypothetical protein
MNFSTTLGTLFSPTDTVAVLFAATEHWWITIIPFVVCIIGVNFFFRHFLWVTWYATKILISAMLYTQVKQVVYTSVGIDPMGFEAYLFGVANGALDMSKIMGRNIVGLRVLGAVAEVCPKCIPLLFPYGPDEIREPEEVQDPEEISEVVEDEDNTSWMNWARSN